jgi:hypothetical protein
MESPTFLQRHPAVRWVAPSVLLVAALAYGAISIFGSSGGQPRTLRWTTPADLVSHVETAPATGYSGTVVAQLSLGLPNLPFVSLSGSSLAPLLNGSHTLRYYYGGPQLQRVALLGVSSETDVFRDGSQLWQWSSSTRVATHCVLPASGAQPVTIASMTPQQLTQWAFAAMGSATETRIAQGADVAGRAVYELVLTPSQRGTRIGSVHIEIDAGKLVPLGVQVYGTDPTRPALDVAFTSVTFAAPPASYFDFRPPSGSRVAQAPATGLLGTHALDGASALTEGSRWATVIEYHASPAQVAAAAGLLGSSAPRVQGAWGRGRLLDSSLLAVLATDNGRVYVGAVDPSILYRAATASSPRHR